MPRSVEYGARHRGSLRRGLPGNDWDLHSTDAGHRHAAAADSIPGVNESERGGVHSVTQPVEDAPVIHTTPGDRQAFPHTKYPNHACPGPMPAFGQNFTLDTFTDNRVHHDPSRGPISYVHDGSQESATDGPIANARDQTNDFLHFLEDLGFEPLTRSENRTRYQTVGDQGPCEHEATEDEYSERQPAPLPPIDAKVDGLNPNAAFTYGGHSNPFSGDGGHPFGLSNIDHTQRSNRGVGVYLPSAPPATVAYTGPNVSTHYYTEENRKRSTLPTQISDDNDRSVEGCGSEPTELHVQV